MNYSHAKYVKGSLGGAKSARASLNYSLHREADDGKSESRSLVARDGVIDKEELLDKFDNFQSKTTEAGRETFYYRMIINPGDGKNDVDKVQYIDSVMDRLEDLHMQRGARMEWAAVVHDNQGNHDHVHVTMVTDKSLIAVQLNQLRDKIAPESWRDAVRSRDDERSVETDREMGTLPQLAKIREDLER